MALRICTLPLIALMLLAIGCETTPTTTHLPAPNFNAPPLAVQPAPRPNVAASPPQAAPAPQTGIAGVPREWIPVVRANNWRWIVIHHSATPTGSVASFDRMHRQKGWDECGYHFVIGNGSNTGDGRVEVGPRWPKQKWGAHAKTADNRYNEFGIGICLVGNFQVARPTARQQQELARLVAHLMRTYNIPPERVIGHRDTKATECPGRHLNIAIVRRQASSVLADAGQTIPDDPATASLGVELLHETGD